MKIAWTNSSLSGLCDRLVDLFLVAAMSRVMGSSELIVPWKVNRNFTNKQLKTWSPARFEDYKCENFLQYFEPPHDVRILTENDFFNFRLEGYTHFTDYLGGVFTPKTFHERYLTKICTLTEFKSTHDQVVKELTPRKKLLDIIGESPELDLAIHLRRGDKVNDNPNDVEISNDSLSTLDEMTKSCIDKLILKKENGTIFICSDEDNSLKEYEKRYSNCILLRPAKTYTEVERTYVDLYMMSRAKIIIMSQKHSNFSLFASQMGGGKLVYFYKDNSMIVDGKIDNVVFHTEID